MKTKVSKTKLSGSVGIERKLKGPMLNTGQKYSTKKRNPIAGTMPGWGKGTVCRGCK